MKQNIDIDEATLSKLKIISSTQGLSIKAILERAVNSFINNIEKEKFEQLNDQEKEDLGLMILMQQANKNETVSEDEFFQSLYE
ncbi:hypothetical protein [Autumnicola edwardsiae]|uniref:Uncharacterized protein n=1 Tax=Autumnicola edwardsiae TaxID=3075594 RepID=A0ABU3CRD9_9FLAO|nr:hypothetical protein [Zunongwangia sp. F297]MDT0648520.1 hypothetical protein [Zunongwangia sp. F297]